jgi:hypothetical protein
MKGLTGYAAMMLKNPGNKYNRTLGGAFVDGHFNVFAVNKYNRTLGGAFVDGHFNVFAVNSLIGSIGVQTICRGVGGDLFQIYNYIKPYTLNPKPFNEDIYDRPRIKRFSCQPCR